MAKKRMIDRSGDTAYKPYTWDELHPSRKKVFEMVVDMIWPKPEEVNDRNAENQE